MSWSLPVAPRSMPARSSVSSILGPLELNSCLSVTLFTFIGRPANSKPFICSRAFFASSELWYYKNKNKNQTLHSKFQSQMSRKAILGCSVSFCTFRIHSYRNTFMCYSVNKSERSYDRKIIIYSDFLRTSWHSFPVFDYDLNPYARLMQIKSFLYSISRFCDCFQ